MKKAGLMLIQDKISISEVAYEVGFSEPSYFSKSFKSYFNMSPKDFVARYRDNANDEIVQQLFEL
jgi:AraC-like DNA-binding protein